MVRFYRLLLVGFLVIVLANCGVMDKEPTPPSIEQSKHELQNRISGNYGELIKVVELTQIKTEFSDSGNCAVTVLATYETDTEQARKMIRHGSFSVKQAGRLALSKDKTREAFTLTFAQNSDDDRWILADMKVANLTLEDLALIVEQQS